MDQKIICVMTLKPACREKITLVISNVASENQHICWTKHLNNILMERVDVRVIVHYICVLMFLQSCPLSYHEVTKTMSLELLLQTLILHRLYVTVAILWCSEDLAGFSVENNVFIFVSLNLFQMPRCLQLQLTLGTVFPFLF